MSLYDFIRDLTYNSLRIREAKKNMAELERLQQEQQKRKQQEMEQYLKGQKDIENKTKLKEHVVVPVKIVAKDKNENGYQTSVRILHPENHYGKLKLQFEGIEILNGRETYMSLIEGDTVNLHYYLRFDENGDILVKPGEEQISIYDYSKEFLSTP